MQKDSSSASQINAVSQTVELKPPQQKWLRVLIKTQRPMMVMPLVDEFSRGPWRGFAAVALVASILGGILARAQDIYEAPGAKRDSGTG